MIEGARGQAKRNLSFSVPAYIGACVSGSIAMALSFALLIVMELPHAAAPQFLFLAAGYGAVFSLPAMLVFLPSTLLSFHAARRYGLSKYFHYAALGAASAAGTGGVLALILMGMAVGAIFDRHGAILLSLLILSGSIAGVIYRWLELLSLRNHEGSV